ncbi:MAG: type VI secretion system protein TssA [Janthinobacterium lividum]
MPLREDLLTPIAGENPSGKNLKYERIYDQIKEARTEEDSTLPAGAWERQAKRADTNLVLKLAGDALATKSKDLQLAVWLGEAHIKREGASMLQPVLTLLLNLQQEFWPSIYPEIDEGDAGLRSVPLQWAANQYAKLVYDLPLTKTGITYHSYKAARALGYEADAQNNEAKTKARQEALKRGSLTAEDVDDGIAASPKSFYANLDDALQAARESLDELAVYCEEQYGDDGPSYRKLRDSLDEVQNLVNSLLGNKRAVEPDVTAAADPEPVAEPEPPPLTVAATPTISPASPTVLPPAPAPITAAPAAAHATVPFNGSFESWDDAAAQVQACAAYMHTQRQGSSVPYLLYTSLRWGELRKHGPKPPLDVLVPPPGEVRAGLKIAHAEKAWSDLLSRGMVALGDPSARVWLDLHRYLWTATRENGYAAFAAMIITAVQGILKEYPELPQWTFMDDTPTANADTLRWIEEIVLADVSVASITPAATATSFPTPAPIQLPTPVTNDDETSDAFVTAAALAAAGQLGAATALLTRDALQQPSGRMRYNRRMQIAELCLLGGSPNVATPILRELIDEMERRNLESWEAGDLITRPIALILRAQNGSMDPNEREALFARLCRIDPSAALEVLG